MQIIFTSRIPQGKQNPWHRRCTKIQGRVLRAQTHFFFFLPTWCSSAEGSKGQACGGDDAEMVYPIPCKSSPLDRGEELGRGCFRQLKSKGPGLGRAGTLSERAGGQRAFYWREGLGLRSSIWPKRQPLLRAFSSPLSFTVSRAPFPLLFHSL